MTFNPTWDSAFYFIFLFDISVIFLVLSYVRFLFMYSTLVELWLFLKRFRYNVGNDDKIHVAATNRYHWCKVFCLMVWCAKGRFDRLKKSFYRVVWSYSAVQIRVCVNVISTVCKYFLAAIAVHYVVLAWLSPHLPRTDRDGVQANLRKDDPHPSTGQIFGILQLYCWISPLRFVTATDNPSTLIFTIPWGVTTNCSPFY